MSYGIGERRVLGVAEGGSAQECNQAVSASDRLCRSHLSAQLIPHNPPRKVVASAFCVGA